MSDVKLSVKIGQIEFAGEGQQEWVEAQLEKILAKANGLIADAPNEDSAQQPPHTPMQRDSTIAGTTLPAYLAEVKAGNNQVRKFLATAAWLEAKGQTSITTGDVVKTLKVSHQKKLTNASDCLNRNVKKGYCEKDGKTFFVTDPGKESLNGQ